MRSRVQVLAGVVEEFTTGKSDDDTIGAEALWVLERIRVLSLLAAQIVRRHSSELLVAASVLLKLVLVDLPCGPAIAPGL